MTVISPFEDDEKSPSLGVTVFKQSSHKKRSNRMKRIKRIKVTRLPKNAVRIHNNDGVCLKGDYVQRKVYQVEKASGLVGCTIRDCRALGWSVYRPRPRSRKK